MPQATGRRARRALVALGVSLLLGGWTTAPADSPIADAEMRGDTARVRALLKQFIAAEDPAKPLSDNQLSDLLKEQGIECARGTVAKYREAVRIAPANLRKSL